MSIALTDVLDAEPRFPGPRQFVPIILHAAYAGPREEGKLLAPAQYGDAGIDLYATEAVILRPGERALVGTGISLALPEGWEAQVRSKSGRALKEGLIVLNAPGTIDHAFRGECQVILYNANPAMTPELVDAIFDAFHYNRDPAQMADAFNRRYAEQTITIAKGQKIAQLVFAKFERPQFVVTDQLPESSRGMKGFGSTGI